MSMPTPGEARIRETAYKATEHWWRSRVEALEEQARNRSEWDLHIIDGIETDESAARRSVWRTIAAELRLLIAERNPR